jgi:2-phospho-L-lactate guanylyltransferase
MSEAPHAAGGRPFWAVVPYKGPLGSKRRLASLLDEDERARLSLAMLDDSLEALLGEPRIERVLLITPAGIKGPWGGHARLHVVHEAEAVDQTVGWDALNAAIRQAQTLASASGADALLAVPGDLPIVSVVDIAALVDASGTAPVTIAPDRSDEGTNALLLAPPSAIEPSFGVASFARHSELARQAGLARHVVRRPGLALDLDTPADVALLLANGQDCRAARLLRGLNIAGRLDRLAAQARSTTT